MSGATIQYGMALLVAVLVAFSCYRAGWRLGMILTAAAVAGGAVALMGRYGGFS
jgi:hypothetical protein